MAAELIELGVGARPAVEPRWDDEGGVTVIVAFDVGQRGEVLIDGHVVSPEASRRLAGCGFSKLLGKIADGTYRLHRQDESDPATATPDTDPDADQTPDPGDGEAEETQ